MNKAPLLQVGRVLALSVGLAIPITGACAAVGCSDSERELEDACGFLATKGNCAEQFANDVGAACGMAGRGNAPTGTFLSRDTLDVCILGSPLNGQVIFDPPLDLKTFPPSEMTFRIARYDGEPCAEGRYANSGASFAVSVEPYPADGGTAFPGSGDQTAPALTLGGSIALDQQPGRRVLDLSCGAETHHFDRFELGIPACTYGALLPRAEIEANPGAIDQPGRILLRVYYEPADAEASSALSVVEYFDCAIPAAPRPCEDGIRNGAETDIDCGGPVALCSTRCAAGAKCIANTDCEPNHACVAGNGLKTCQ